MGVNKLQPWYITGLTDGEGCFAINVSKHKTKKIRRDAWLSFEIELRADDKPLLEKLRATWGVGHIYILNYERYGWKPHVKYHLRGLKELTEILIPFFRHFPLVGKKRKDFELFVKAAEVIRSKEHLKERGINKLLKIRQFMNERRPINSSAFARVRENRAPGGMKT